MMSTSLPSDLRFKLIASASWSAGVGPPLPSFFEHPGPHERNNTIRQTTPTTLPAIHMLVTSFCYVSAGCRLATPACVFHNG